MQKRWIAKPIPPSDTIIALSSAININQHLATILLQRGINTFAEAKDFFRPSLRQLHDPFLLKDMSEAIARIQQAIEQEEKILIYGDYDVDGTTAVALVNSYLKQFYPHCDFYIPDRYSEGYGVSEAGIIWAEQNNFSLIIALDLGIKAADMVTLASHKGIDFIICDHHLPGGKIPNAVAVLDPKREDCDYPYKELSGCGLGFKLIQAYAQKYRKEEEVFDYLDLVVVSIASDIVPISGENRILAHFGLAKLNSNPRPGLKALKDLTSPKNDLDISGIVFTLGPRINAAGRIDHARGAVELLIASTESQAHAFAEKINVKNDLRREFDLNITEEAIAMVMNNPKLKDAKTTVLYKETWHKGVIGIVAARCVEKFYRPTVILTESNNKITGSARSIKDFDLYQAIDACGDLLEKYGGHKYAAGLTLSKENLPAFQERFEQIATERLTEDMLLPMFDVDLVIASDEMTAKFNNILKQMAPFGPDNLRPLFEARNVFVQNSLSGFKDRHIRFLAGQQNNKALFNAVGFDLIAHYDLLASGHNFDILFTLEENIYQGITSLQIRIKDIKPSRS